MKKKVLTNFKKIFTFLLVFTAIALALSPVFTLAEDSAVPAPSEAAPSVSAPSQSQAAVEAPSSTASVPQSEVPAASVPAPSSLPENTGDSGSSVSSVAAEEPAGASSTESVPASVATPDSTAPSSSSVASSSVGQQPGFAPLAADVTPPSIAVKPESVGTDPYFQKVSFKLSDSGKVAGYEVNGVYRAITPAPWGDANDIFVGSPNSAAVYGENTIVAIDLAGNRTTKVFYLDNVAPTITLKSAAEGTVGSGPYSNACFKLFDEYNIKGYWLNGVFFAVSSNQWSDTDNVSVSSHNGAAVEGKNTLIAEDMAGNQTSYEFYLDATPPTITVKPESVGTDPYFQKAHFKLFDSEKIAGYELNGVYYAVSPNKWGDADNISVGSHNGNAVYGENTIVAIDLAGNRTTKVFYLDNVAPTITLKNTAEGTVGSGPYSNACFKLFDEYKIKGYWLNGTFFPVSPNKWSDANNISVGSHGGAAVEGKNIIIAEDMAGNQTSYEFYLDATPPTITVKPESVGTDPYFQKVHFKLFDSEKIAGYELNGVYYAVSPDKWSDANDIFVGSPNSAAVYGENTIVAIDLAGNRTTKVFYLDNVAPTITLKNTAEGTVGSDPYSNACFKLFDEYKIKGYWLNGTFFPVSPNKWSDANNISVGSHGGAAVEGKNIIIAEDMAGNQTSYEFYLDGTVPVLSNFRFKNPGTSYVKSGKGVLVYFTASEVLNLDNTLLTIGGKVADIAVENATNNTYRAYISVTDMVPEGYLVVEVHTYSDLAGNPGAPVLWDVTAQAGNHVIVDKTPPVIQLNGSGTISITTDETYTELYATVTDNFDATKTNVAPSTINYYNTSGQLVGPVAAVNAQNPGRYELIYTATDTAGNVAASVTRTVLVTQAQTPAPPASSSAPPPSEHQPPPTTPANSAPSSGGATSSKPFTGGNTLGKPASSSSSNLQPVANTPALGASQVEPTPAVITNSGQTVSISPSSTPLASAETSHWSIWNLILTLGCFGFCISTFIAGRNKSFKFLAIIIVVAALFSFIFSQDFTGKALLADNWSVFFAVLALIEIALYVLSKVTTRKPHDA